MTEVHQQSFFDDLKQSSPKIWSEFSQALYSDDSIEVQQNCHYLSQGSRIWKPLYIELGVRTLYFTRKGEHTGLLSLNFATLSLKNYKGQKLLCFSKNRKVIEIKVDDPEKMSALLVKKCILTSFHEDFMIEKLIANGNKKAMVYQGIRKSNNERVAIKAYNKQYIRKFPKGIECLKNEIKAMRMFSSEHIIHLLEVHETENSIYLIMDLIEGGQLSQRMSLYNSEQNIRQFMFNLIKTLSLIHQQNLILRNITPENILFKNKDNLVDLVIIDFGEIQFDQTQYQPLRTSGFMAPELLDSQTVNTKCDIYSAGVIFYWLVVSNISEEDLYKTKRIFCNLEGKKFKQAPKALQSIIKKMLRLDPKRRYSAEKCLQHRFFKTIIDTVDNLNEQESLKTISNRSQEKQIISVQLIGIDSENDNCQNEQQPQQNVGSTKSMPSKFSKEGTKIKPNYSKFCKFCSEMEEFAINSPQNKKKEFEESLFKTAIKNNFRKQEYSKDDNQVVQKKMLKKSNSLNV